jgi:ribosomal-protein-alanine N-acetyltransferase
VAETETPITLRRLLDSDVPAAMALEHELFGDEAWTEGMLRDELSAPTRHYVVAAEDGQVVGYGGLCVYDEEAFIQTIAVTAARQRRGIGRSLLLELIAESERRGARSLLLEVRADNVAAQALYAAHGFAPVGLRKGYYQPSGADALVMMREGEGA